MNDAGDGWFSRALRRSDALGWIALIAVALVLPTLGVGLLLDDWTHRMALDPAWQHPGSIRGPWDLYRFVTDDPEYRRLALDRGILPWWTVESFRLAFLRPLASLSVAFDHAVLGRHPWAMHLENALWYGAMTLSAASVYRTTLPRARLVALAALLFAVDHTHTMLVLWVANRHAMLSALFAFASFAAHVRWRSGARPRDRAIALALFVAALACGESTLAIGGYFAAWTLWNDPERTPARWRALAPYAVLTAAWAVIYRQQGCGAFGGDYYIDPLRAPMTFLHAVIERAPVLILAQVALPPAEFMLYRTIPLSLAIAAALALLGRPLWRLVREDPMSRTWLAGGLLALVPGCATLPNDRLLLFPGLGALALLATVFERAWWSGDTPSRVTRWIVGALAVVHLGLSPLLLPLRSLNNAQVAGGYVDRSDASLPSNEALRSQLLVVVTAPDTLGPMWVFARRVPEGRPFPGRGLRQLVVPSLGACTLRRDGPRSLVLTCSVGLPHDMFGPLYRGRAHPFRVGDVAHTGGMRAEVRALTSDGRAREVRFEWDRPLEDPGYRWVQWRGFRYEAFTPPAIGESPALEPIDWIRAMMGG